MSHAYLRASLRSRDVRDRSAGKLCKIMRISSSIGFTWRLESSDDGTWRNALYAKIAAMPALPVAQFCEAASWASPNPCLKNGRSARMSKSLSLPEYLRRKRLDALAPAAEEEST